MAVACVIDSDPQPRRLLDLDVGWNAPAFWPALRRAKPPRRDRCSTHGSTDCSQGIAGVVAREPRLTEDALMDRCDRLQAIEDIRSLKAQYFRCMDTKQWDELATLLTPDMTVISPNGSVWLEGGAAFAASLRQSLEYSVSVHQGFTAEIEIIDDDNARAVWAMQDVIEWEDGHPREGWKSIVGRGHYHDTYRRLDGRWQIATLSLTRLRLDVS